MHNLNWGSTMVAVSCLTSPPRSCLGFSQPYNSKSPFRIGRRNETRYNGNNVVPLVARNIFGRILKYSATSCPTNMHVSRVGRDHNQLSYQDDLPQEPFWLGLIREAIWSLKSLFMFLVEQPGQLKYIEWPSFQSTLKTAMLTLVLVAVLIVALSSVDSVLSYLLALLLRRTA